MSIDYKYATLFDLIDELVGDVNDLYSEDQFNHDMQLLYYRTAFNYLIDISNELERLERFGQRENFKNRIKKLNEYTEILERLVTRLYPSCSHVSSVALSYRTKRC